MDKKKLKKWLFDFDFYMMPPILFMAVMWIMLVISGILDIQNVTDVLVFLLGIVVAPIAMFLFLKFVQGIWRFIGISKLLNSRIESSGLANWKGSIEYTINWIKLDGLGKRVLIWLLQLTGIYITIIVLAKAIFGGNTPKIINFIPQIYSAVLTGIYHRRYKRYLAENNPALLEEMFGSRTSIDGIIRRLSILSGKIEYSKELGEARMAILFFLVVPMSFQFIELLVVAAMR